MSNDPQNKVYNSGVLFACKLIVSLILFLLISTTLALAQDLVIEPTPDEGGGGYQDGISATYTDSWWEGFSSGDFDELAPVQPTVVAYSVGQMDPEFYDQTISVETSLVTETGRTVSSISFGYSSASVMVTMSLAYDEAQQSYEIGNYTVSTTYNSVTGEMTAIRGIGGIGISLSCYNLLFVTPPLATYTRFEPCNTACGSAGDRLVFRYDPARGAPFVVVVAEPYTKIGPVKLCTHRFIVRRVIVGPCQCGNIEAPILLPPTLPIPNFDGSSCSTIFASKCMMYGGDFDFETCTCLGCGSCGGSPILIDVAGNGFNLTAAAAGVPFDLESNRMPKRWSWTTENSDDAWLALDRNGNGTIDDGSELFGNFTHQPASDTPNGFIALAEFDSFARGGNGDGAIGPEDAIYPYLRLWQDRNHNGVSEPNELHSMTSLNVQAIDLAYKESKMTDQHHNRFVYRSKIKNRGASTASRWAYDVFLVEGSQP